MEGLELEVFEKIQDIVVNELNLNKEEVTLETTFSDDLGIDSIDLFQIVMALEDEYSVQFSNEDAEGIKSVKDVVTFIVENA